MQTFLNNIFDMGVYKLFLWLFMCVLFFGFFELLIKSLEFTFNFSSKLNIFDIINLTFWLFIYISGIYRFYTPIRKGKKK